MSASHSSNVVPLRPSARTLATARLRRAIYDSGLTQHEAGQLVGVDGRQLRRWLSGDVSLGALELFVELERRGSKRRAA